MATVTIAGTAGTTTVDPADGATALDVLTEAAQTMGVDIDTSKLKLVVNGADAAPETLVGPGDRVTAAPAVNNG